MGYSIVDLTLEEINVILSGLGKLPLEVSHQTFTKIQQQVIPQVQAEQGSVTEGQPIGEV